MTKTQQLLASLITTIEALKIAGYLKEEAISALKYLHLYKLQNIEKNLDSFCEYLLFLNHQNTEKILSLSASKDIKGKPSSRDIHYFFAPSKKISKKESLSSEEKINQSGYEILTLMQGIKGILILSIDEFCNASATRMSIHQMLMQQDQDWQKNKSLMNTKKTSKK